MTRKSCYKRLSNRPRPRSRTTRRKAHCSGKSD